ncbi:uncharacterized protein NEMAJ01_1433 [Nematocida major]|uniref:uncharacterized protein n=1 Tax=Nematocida major TaxID=1912982 RepID=UPI00200801AD|nr:uncharacterized protein NEMAJ01_1433 [Nematocida major]KAH9386537.1 hypothetical protein NEMAJ01_1433 [Nematocida major]
MCIRWVYEAIDSEVAVQVHSGNIVKGVLREVDKRENMRVETQEGIVLISSTSINAVVLPDFIEHVIAHCKRGRN